MQILEIREKSIPIHSSIQNAVIDFSKMNISAVAVVTDIMKEGKRVIGFGFNSNGRYAQSDLINNRLVPRIMELSPDQYINKRGDNFDPIRLKAAMLKNEKPGGHGERAIAVAAIEIAIWDAVAKISETPLWKLLGGQEAQSKVFVYAAGGYYDAEKGITGLRDEVNKYLDSGYTWVKIKIGGKSLDQDLKRIDAALELLGSGDKLAVDANGRFDRKTAFQYADALESYELRWFEEPCDPLDYSMNAEVVARYRNAIATGENLFSLQDATNLLRHAGLRSNVDYVQFDPSLAYGVTENIEIIKMMSSNGWSAERFFPHGGNLLSLALTSAFQLGGCESYPGVFQPFGGFADCNPIENGFVHLPEEPGIGFESKADLYNLLSTLARD